MGSVQHDLRVFVQLGGGFGSREAGKMAGIRRSCICSPDASNAVWRQPNRRPLLPHSEIGLLRTKILQTVLSLG